MSIGRIQGNFEARIKEYGALLKSLLAELELDLPEREILGVYEPGEEYEFYHDLKTILQMGTHDVFVIDPYADLNLFDIYAGGISRQAKFRLLSNKIQSDVVAVAQMYASGGNFSLRSSDKIHDRVIFVDERVWLAGQSIKDAAKKKPTYIVEHAESLMRAVYEPIWAQATVIL